MARRKWTYETIQQVMNGDNPFIQVGYTGKPVKRKVGDEWTDGKGITWRKTVDGKIQVNKQMDAIREMVKQVCSVCGQRIDFSCDKLDQKVFPKTGMCFDCLQVKEMELRLDQKKWEAYENKKVMSNKLGALKDFREKVIETINFLKNDTGKMGEVMSTGEIVTFTGKSNPQWLIDAETDLVKVNDEIKKMEDEISRLEEVVK